MEFVLAFLLIILTLTIVGGALYFLNAFRTTERFNAAVPPVNIDNIKTVSKAMNLTPERSQRNSRDDAIKIAEFYPAGLKVGSFVEVNAPFAADAYRVENGAVSAGPGCSRAGCENIKTQTIIKHPAITTRVAAVDEELGIVLLRMNFGDTGSYGPGNALIVWEAFKVYGGQSHAVEAFKRVMPASAGSGWD